MKNLLLLLSLLTSGWANAQTTCSDPKLKILHNQQEIKASRSALVSTVTLALTNGPGCPTATSYQFQYADIALIRGKYPVLPILRSKTPEVDLSSFQKFARPGDRIYIEVHGVTAATAGGKSQPSAAGRSVELNWKLSE